jgi:hypothetical protein
VIAEPPVDVGAVKAMIAVPFPGVTIVIVGAPGFVRGITELLADTAPPPAAFMPFIRTVYVVPFVRLEIVIGLANDAVS